MKQQFYDDGSPSRTVTEEDECPFCNCEQDNPGIDWKENIRENIANTCEIIRVCEEALDGEGEAIKQHVANVLHFSVRKELRFIEAILGAI